MRRGLTTFGENTTATHCGNCPHAESTRHAWCDHFGAVHVRQRAPECVQSERAFDDAVREAKIGALRWVRENVGVEDVGYYQEHWRVDVGAIDAEIKRLESEGR